MAYLNKRGTSECFAPRVPQHKREKDDFRKAVNVCMAGQICVLCGEEAPVYDHKMFKPSSKENKYGLI